MSAQILVAILVVAVAVMVGADVVKTKTEDPSGQPDGLGYEVRQPIGGTRVDHAGAYTSQYSRANESRRAQELSHRAISR